MKNLIKRIWYKLFPCKKHHWVQGAEYWHKRDGKNYDYLLPSPMAGSPEYQANCYVCDKCGKSITVVEKTETGELVGIPFCSR